MGGQCLRMCEIKCECVTHSQRERVKEREREREREREKGSFMKKCFLIELKHCSAARSGPSFLPNYFP